MIASRVAWLTAGVLVLTFFQLQADENPESSPTKHANPETRDGHVRWELLWFGPDHRITKARLVLVDRASSPWGNTGIVKDRLDTETSEPEVLRSLEFALHLPLTVGVSSDPKDGAGSGWNTIGKLILSTTRKEDIVIDITNAGFSLVEESGDIQTFFYSWGVAQHLDDLLFAARKQHLPLEIFESFSGEHYIRGSKENYFMMQAQKKKNRSK